jgi:plasmid maintenance system antidote protein VapI
MNLLSKNNKKKTIVLALAGAFAITGIGTTYLNQTAFAATTDTAQQDQGQMLGEHKGTPKVMTDEMAQQFATTFNIDKKVLLNYQTKGYTIRDFNQAALIASAGNKSFTDVMNAKTATNSWKDVMDSFSITNEQLQQAAQGFMSKQIATMLQIDESTVTGLLKDGYQPTDIVMASVLSKQASKTIPDVLNMKKINNTWKDVATSLGIDETTFNQCMTDLKSKMPKGPGMHRDRGMGNRESAPAAQEDTTPAQAE